MHLAIAAPASEGAGQLVVNAGARALPAISAGWLPQRDREWRDRLHETAFADDCHDLLKDFLASEMRAVDDHGVVGGPEGRHRTVAIAVVAGVTFGPGGPR